MKLDDKLVDDWKEAHKWLSTRIAFAIMVLPEVYNQMHELIAPYVSQSFFRHLMAILGVLMLISIVKKKADAEDTK